MADQTQTILIDVKVEASAALQRQTELKAALEAVKKEQAELAKTVGVSSEAYIRNEAQIKNLNNQILNNSKIIQANEQQVNSVDGAYRKLNDTYLFAAAKAKDLAAAYGANDARTKEAVATAKQYSDQLKAVDDSVGQNQRNVGNYAGSLDTVNNRFIQGLVGANNFIKANGGLAGSFKAGGQAVAGFGKQLLALLANPIVAFIAAIVGAFLLLKKGLDSNGEATKKLSQIFAPFKALLEATFSVIGKFVNVLLTGVQVLGEWAGKVMQLIPGLKQINDASNESIRIEKEKQRLIREGILDKAQDAKEELRIADLKKKINQSDIYSKEQRLAFAREVDKIGRKLAQDDAKRANDSLKNFLARMKQQGKAFKDYTDAELQEFSELQANKFKQQQAYYDNTRKTASKTAELTKELEAEEQARQEKIRENNVKAQDKQLAKLETNLAIYQEKNKTMTAKNLKDIEEMEMTILKKKLSFGKITQEEYTLEKLQIEQKYSEGVISLTKKTEDERLKTLKAAADKAVEQMNYEFELYKLKEQERLAGQKLTDEQLHKNKLDGLQKEYKTELDKLGERLDSEEITLDEYNKQVVLLNQQKNTNIALENADFDAKQLELKKQALAIEAQAEFDLKQLQYQNQFDAERAALDAQYQQQIDAANKVGADTTALTAIYEKQKTKIAEKENEARFNVLSNVAGNLAELFGKETALGKAAASAQVAIQTYQGAMSAWTAAQVFPAPFNSIVGAASVAATVALGAKSVSDIWAVKAEGINSGSGGGSKPSMSVPSITGGIVNRQSGQIEQSAQRKATSDALAEQKREVVLVTNDLTTALNEKTSLKVENSI